MSIVLGAALPAFPSQGGNLIVSILGAYAVTYGGLTIVDAIRVRGAEHDLHHAA